MALEATPMSTVSAISSPGQKGQKNDQARRTEKNVLMSRSPANRSPRNPGSWFASAGAGSYHESRMPNQMITILAKLTAMKINCLWLPNHDAANERLGRN